MSRPQVESRPASLNRGDRPARAPINGLRDVLQVRGKEPGWHYCWVNDDQVARFEAAWYEFVTHPVIVGDRRIDVATQQGNKVSLKVGADLTGYLMRVQDEFYLEDMKAIDAETNKREETLRRNLNSNDNGRYGKVEIEQRTGTGPGPVDKD